MKANRFLDKASVQKEKTKIKTEIKSQYIASGPAKSSGASDKRVFVKDGKLEEETNSEKEQQDEDFVDIDEESDYSDCD